MGEASEGPDPLLEGGVPSAVAAAVALCNRAVVDIRSLARTSRQTRDPDPLDQIMMIASACDGLASALGRSLRREDAAREALAYRWSASSGPARTWIAETLLAADPGYQTLIQEWERSREESLSAPPAAWVEELGIDESDPTDWRRAFDTGDGTR